MDKQDIKAEYNHCISLFERKNLTITGIKKIENFDKEQFLLETVMGFLVIKGIDLELIKLDTLQGTISIGGTISSINYVSDAKSKSKDNSIFDRLFK